MTARSICQIKGVLIPNGTFLDYVAKIQEGISSLLQATKDGQRSEWISKHKSESPLDASGQQIITDIFATHYFDTSRLIFQCEICNKIWIQKEDSLDFAPFLSESESGKDILFSAIQPMNNSFDVQTIRGHVIISVNFRCQETSITIEQPTLTSKIVLIRSSTSGPINWSYVNSKRPLPDYRIQAKNCTVL